MGKAVEDGEGEDVGEPGCLGGRGGRHNVPGSLGEDVAGREPSDHAEPA